MKFLLFSSLLGLGLAGPDNDQANCQSVSGGGCGASPNPNSDGNSVTATDSVDCLDSSNPADTNSYCRCRWGFRGVGSLGENSPSGATPGTRLGCMEITDVCGNGIVEGSEHCDFSIVSEAASLAEDEAGGTAVYTQRDVESGNCGLTTDCRWDSCPWRIARNAPTPLVKWQATGNKIERSSTGSGVDLNFALWYPKTYHSTFDNYVQCDEMDENGNDHMTPDNNHGEPYDQHPGISDGDNWHWPAGRNIGANSIDLASASQEGGNGASSCYALNQGNAAGCSGFDPATCEQGWTRAANAARGVNNARQDACAHSIYYQADFKNVVDALCFTMKDNGVAQTLSYFTSYIRIHNVEVDLDVEDLRNAQYTMGQMGVDNGSPGGMFSRIFTRRTIDIELPFYITFNRTVEATAELAVTSALFGFSAVVDYVEYIVNAFGTGSEFEDGSTRAPQDEGPGLGSGAGSITIATSINPGYKLSANHGATHGTLSPSASTLGADGNVKWTGPTNVGDDHPYLDTSFGCDPVHDYQTLDGGGAHRCEQFWGYTVEALACSFAGVFSTEWDVQCNKVDDSGSTNQNAFCPGADSYDGIVYSRDDSGSESNSITNKVAITFTLDPGPDDCVQEFENDVVLSATLNCASTDGGGTTEVFHNQMLFCTLVIDSGVDITDSNLVLVENKGPTDARLYPADGSIPNHHADIYWATSYPDPNVIKFEFRVTPKQFQQDFDARNPWTIYAQAKVDYDDGTDAQSRRLLSLSPSLAEQRSKCLENGCADIGPIRSLLQLEEEGGGAVQGQSKAYISGLDYQPDVPVVADDVYLADLDMGMEDEEDAAQPIVLNTLVLAGLGFLAMN